MTNVMSTASTNTTANASINFHYKKGRYKMDFAHSFISDHFIYNFYYLLSLCKTQVKTKNMGTLKCKNIKMEI